MFQNQNLLKLFYYTVIQSIAVISKHLKYFFTFVPNKQFGQLITISPYSLIMLKTTSAEFQSIELWCLIKIVDHMKQKIADKTTSVGKKKVKTKENERQEIYIPPEKRQQIIDDLRFF